MAEPFAAIERVAREGPLDELPELQAWLGRVGGLVSMRYAREPRPAIAPTTAEERLLTVEEAAARLSKTPDWIYHHRRELPFARKLGGHLRFSDSGLNDWIREAACPSLAAQDVEKPGKQSRRRLLTVKP
jgi:excisionase family DNA binding protein